MDVATSAAVTVLAPITIKLLAVVLWLQSKQGMNVATSAAVTALAPIIIKKLISPKNWSNIRDIRHMERCSVCFSKFLEKPTNSIIKSLSALGGIVGRRETLVCICDCLLL